MKFFFALMALAATALAAHHPIQDDTVMLFHNAIDNLIKDALEYVRKQLKEHEPLKVPDIPQQVINDDETKVYLTADLTDVYVSKASDFVVDKIENNLVQFWAKFGVTIPSMHLDGKYKINGNAVGKKVEGQGSFTADITQLKVSGFIQMEIVDHSLHMKELNLDYDLQDLKFKIDGLVVEGVTEEQLEELFNTQLLKFFQDNKSMVCDRVARQVMIEANEIMKGKTLQEVLDWLKNIIN